MYVIENCVVVFFKLNFGLNTNNSFLNIYTQSNIVMLRTRFSCIDFAMIF